MTERERELERLLRHAATRTRELRYVLVAPVPDGVRRREFDRLAEDHAAYADALDPRRSRG